jgi:hypothetical protein
MYNGKQIRRHTGVGETLLLAPYSLSVLALGQKDVLIDLMAASMDGILQGTGLVQRFVHVLSPPVSRHVLRVIVAWVGAP